MGRTLPVYAGRDVQCAPLPVDCLGGQENGPNHGYSERLVIFNCAHGLLFIFVVTFQTESLFLYHAKHIA